LPGFIFCMRYSPFSLVSWVFPTGYLTM